MKRQLPDVNVLLALIWSQHRHYGAAHAWFKELGHHAWATNTLTQLGVLRLLTNFSVMREEVSAATANSVLSANIQHKAHEFWPLDRITAISLELVVGRIRGHKQWTDAVLLCQAAERDGVLVTLDAGIKELAPNELKSRVLLLTSGEIQVNGTTY